MLSDSDTNGVMPVVALSATNWTHRFHRTLTPAP